MIGARGQSGCCVGVEVGKYVWFSLDYLVGVLGLVDLVVGAYVKEDELVLMNLIDDPDVTGDGEGA